MSYNVKNVLLYFYNYSFNFNLNKTSYVSSKLWDGTLAETTHISSIGDIMYTSYSIWLILTSIILLLAMVGAIVITIKQSQNILKETYGVGKANEKPKPHIFADTYVRSGLVSSPFAILLFLQELHLSLFHRSIEFVYIHSNYCNLFIVLFGLCLSVIFISRPWILQSHCADNDPDQKAVISTYPFPYGDIFAGKPNRIFGKRPQGQLTEEEKTANKPNNELHQLDLEFTLGNLRTDNRVVTELSDRNDKSARFLHRFFNGQYWRRHIRPDGTTCLRYTDVDPTCPYYKSYRLGQPGEHTLIPQIQEAELNSHGCSSQVLANSMPIEAPRPPLTIPSPDRWNPAWTVFRHPYL